MGQQASGKKQAEAREQLVPRLPLRSSQGVRAPAHLLVDLQRQESASLGLFGIEIPSEGRSRSVTHLTGLWEIGQAEKPGMQPPWAPVRQQG